MPWKETDPKKYQRELERDLVIGAGVLLVVVGSVLTGAIYGWEAAFGSLLCLLPGAGVLFGLWYGMRKIEDHVRKE